MADNQKFYRQAAGVNAFIFFTTFLSGVVLIVVSKLLSFPQLIVTIFPVAVMLGYAVIVVLARNLRLRLDQAGDNLYYLGFLFTLTSLAYSLVEFATSSTAASSIISNFGIAIATTIVGLMLRVLFGQMRTDPVETEHLARIELAEAARHLKRELDNSVREFSMFRRSLQQIISETFTELQGTIDETVRDGLSRFATGVEQFSYVVSEANKGFDDRSNALTTSAERLVASIADLGERVKGVRAPEELLEQQLGPSIKKIEASAENLFAHIAALAARINLVKVPDDVLVRAFNTAVATINYSSEKLGKAISGLGDDIQAIDLPSDILVGRLTPGIEELRNAADLLAKVLAATAENLSAIELSRERIVLPLENAAESFAEAGERAKQLHLQDGGRQMELVALAERMSAAAERLASSFETPRASDLAAVGTIEVSPTITALESEIIVPPGGGEVR